MANSDIREDLFKDDTAKRIVIKVKTKTLNPSSYLTSAKNIVNEIFPRWESDHRILFLVIDVWSERTFMVIDINNRNYDFRTAHNNTMMFPVYVLRQHGRRQTWVLIRWHQLDERMSLQLADLHRVNGYEATLPFLEDHNSRIVHANPRDLQ
ncbi:hypothetical protein BDV32DRAFT_159301 [Aspergillus pseudonomiae]|uniref:Uncharacterized protein n=1 Tax=Aspergillus pseudonomiae TaxID=1506151 RepID=A0A5N7DPE3_9EURO|nr:uncharacterized protein BDV37DRAFT_279227 [Aspergillus pseudonomiae]KAB8259363.1 hypothetical protein BDV32DRAFT_159301 [Aspergillus pseudonomiae]KAE8408286.1 hypothetical protein BDV37DRAFT_279227 [Aspergillus pseudonomiae]